MEVTGLQISNLHFVDNFFVSLILNRLVNKQKQGRQIGGKVEGTENYLLRSSAS